jgi:AmiR/NasT family two-component response regulator
MPAGSRVLVIDNDATSQGEIQKLLVSRRFVALGGIELGEEIVTMARAFQPQLVLLSLDNGQESHAVADLVLSEFPEARLIVYSHGKDLESVNLSVGSGLDCRRVKVVSTDERALLAAMESALTTPQEQAPIEADNGSAKISPLPPVAPVSGEAWGAKRVAPSGKSLQYFLRNFAQLASDWLLTRSLQAEQSLMATLADDVQAPFFGGRGREVVLQGLEAIAWRLGSGFRLVPIELGAETVLAVMAEANDGRWHRAGYFVLRVTRDGTVTYLDYRRDEPSQEDEPASTSGLADDPY